MSFDTAMMPYPPAAKGSPYLAPPEQGEAREDLESGYVAPQRHHHRQHKSRPIEPPPIQRPDPPTDDEACCLCNFFWALGLTLLATLATGLFWGLYTRPTVIEIRANVTDIYRKSAETCDFKGHDD
jgi:hypothetical protein